MIKLTLLCLLVMLIGTVPVFAADSNNLGTQQLQNQDPQLYQEIMNIKNQILVNLDKITAILSQNKNLRNIMQNLTKNNYTTIQKDVNELKIQIQNL